MAQRAIRKAKSKSKTGTSASQSHGVASSNTELPAVETLAPSIALECKSSTTETVIGALLCLSFVETNECVCVCICERHRAFVVSN